jgi:hypothetical protein
MQANVTHNSRTQPYAFNEGWSAGQTRDDRNLQGATGHGSNVDVIVNGQQVGDDYRLRDGDNVTFRTKASSKARH